MNIDHRIEVDHHNCSVPYQLARDVVDVRISATTVKIFRRGCRVASHLRSSACGGLTTTGERMLEAHRWYLEWTPPGDSAVQSLGAATQSSFFWPLTSVLSSASGRE